MSEPQLETNRLRLRLFSHQDIDDLAPIYSNPHVLRYVADRHPAGADAHQRAVDAVHQFLDHWDAYGFGVWAMVLKKSDTLIGYCGLQYVPGTTEVELLYLMDEPCWNRGLATEAAIASVRDGFQRLKLEHIVAVVDRANAASRRVLEKAGLVQTAADRDEGGPILTYAITQPPPER